MRGDPVQEAPLPPTELLERWRSEIQSAWLYDVVAAAEEDPRRARLFRDLAETARRQGALVLASARIEQAPPFRPSLRARLVAVLVRRLGPRRVLPILAAMKVRGISIYRLPLAPPDAPAPHPPPGAGEEPRHRGARAGGALRAAVFGVNDGLVSNASLIFGIAGAGADTHSIVLTGFAGLLAGSLSMAAGEYVSVRSQRELHEHQIAEEREELELYPQEEADELATIYRARGLSAEDAERLGSVVLHDPERALDTLAREELGLDPDGLGSPLAAAGSSFLSFVAGASIPLVPFAFSSGRTALVAAIALAATGLFAVGATLSLFTGRHALASGLRMLGIGGAAGITTYAIGMLLGAEVS